MVRTGGQTAKRAAHPVILRVVPVQGVIGMGVNRKKSLQPKIERAGDPSSLTPLEYEAAIWVGRGCGVEEIAYRLDLSVVLTQGLIENAMRIKGCRSLDELELLFEPDWARIDMPPESRYEKVNGRMVLRGNSEGRTAARAAYAERRARNWKRLLKNGRN
jgi:DNA-binding CsgD family transcriptional regulator